MVEFGLLASEVPLGFGHLHALSGPQSDEIGFELGHHGEDIEEQPPDRIVRIVDGPAQVEVHLADGELVGDRSCIGEGPGQAIELGDHKGVALSTGSQGLAQAEPFAISARQSVVNVDPTGSYLERGEVGRAWSGRAIFAVASTSQLWTPGASVSVCVDFCSYVPKHLGYPPAGRAARQLDRSETASSSCASTSGAMHSGLPVSYTHL